MILQLPDYNTTITSEAKHYAVYGFGDADGDRFY